MESRARRCFPGSALPFEAFPSSAAVPSSPTGVAFSPLQAAAAGRRARLRTAAPTPLAAADLKALLRCRVRWQGRCHQRPCPDAPLGLFLEEDGRSVLPRHPLGRTERSRGRSRNPGRTRVHPASRPDPTSEDERLVLVGSEGSPRGSALPAEDSPRSGGARRVLTGDVASPRLAQVSHAAQQHAAPRRPKDRFLIPICYRYAQPARRASAALPRSGDQGQLGDARRSDAAAAGPATSSPGCARPPREEIASAPGALAQDGHASRTCFPFPGVCYVKEQVGNMGVSPPLPVGPPVGRR
jgi:hypothetical protein